MSVKVKVDAVGDKLMVDTGETLQVLSLKRYDGVSFDVPLFLTEEGMNNLLQFLYEQPRPLEQDPIPLQGNPPSSGYETVPPPKGDYVQHGGDYPYAVPSVPISLAPTNPFEEPEVTDAYGNFTGDGDVDSW